ncbi:MAG TPA: hypothetical protein VK024_09070 [Actinomycetaceae bacterium]|nr:hypothetical protein [Actinomycetaceae bacterium]
MSKQRRALRVAAGLALAMGLAACAGQPPQPDPDPTPTEALPALSEERVDMILADLQETLEEADAERDPELLTARVAGPALEMRRAEYELSEAANEDRVPTVVSTASQVQVIAATEEWPRSLFVVSEIPEGENLPLLLVLTQEDPRSQYKLTSWTPLLPGAATPPMAKADAGSEMLAADGGDLRLSPQDAVAQYGQLLAGGDDEEATFAEDPFRERYVDAVSQLAETVEVAGELEQNFSVVDGSVAAMATAQDGALVVGVLRNELTLRRTVDGATLRAAGDIGILLGEDNRVEDAVVAEFLFPVAFEVPSADGEEQVAVIGAQQVITGVTRD